MVRKLNLVTDIVWDFARRKDLVEGLAIHDVPKLKWEKIKWIVAYYDINKNNNNKCEIICDSINEANGGKECETYNDWNAKGMNEGIDYSLFDIAVAGGFTSRQAFFIILENFLRNTIKHNAGKIKNKIEQIHDWFLNIHVEIHEKEKLSWFFTLKIWAEIEIENINDKLNKLDNIFNRGLIEQFNGGYKLIREGWGTKEMRIAAAYIRGMPYISLLDTKKPILNVEEKEFGNPSQKTLQVSFDVPRPILLTLYIPNGEDDINSEVLLQNGIHVVDRITKQILTRYFLYPKEKEDEIKKTPKGWLPLHSFPYEFDNNCQDIEVEDHVIKIPNLNSLKQPNKLFIYIEKNCIMDRNEYIILIKQTSFYYNKNYYDIISLHNYDIKFYQDDDPLSKELLEKKIDKIVLCRHFNMNIYEKYKKEAFLEFYSGASKTSLMTSIPNELFIFQLITAALMKVTLIDERLEDLKCKIWWSNLNKAIEFLRLMNICVCTKASNLRNTTEDVEHIKEHARNSHILSIHAGILEKLGIDTKEKVKNFVDELLSDKDTILRRVVIHSGRGVPACIPENEIPFVSYSDIEIWVRSEQLKSKFELVEELLNARGIIR